MWVETDNWEENLGFEIDLTELQVARGQKGQARIRIEWGGIYSIVLRDGAAPTFEKRVSVSKKTAPKTAPAPAPTENNGGDDEGDDTTGDDEGDGTGSDSGAALGVPAKVAKELPQQKKKDEAKPGEVKPEPQWRTVVSMARGGSVDWSKITKIGIRIERIAGRFRFRVRFGEAAPGVYDVIDRRAAPPSPDNDKPASEAIAASWPTAPLRVSFGGVSAHLGGGELRALDAATGQAIAGRFGRKLRAPGAHDQSAVEDAGVAPSLSALGWASDQTEATFPAAEIYQREVGRGLYERALAYVCELAASPDGKDVPLLTNVGYSFAGISESPPERLPLDITPACVGSARIQTGQPPDVPTAEMSLKVDDVILKQLTLPIDAPAGATWKTYVSKYHRIRFRARWNYSDDTQDDYQTLFDGAVYSPARNTARLLQQDLSLTCRDRVMRCTKPWAFIDAKYRAGISCCSTRSKRR